MGDIIDDPLGVFDKYSDEEKREIRERMYAPNVDSKTEWVHTAEGKRLEWTCGECGEMTYRKIRHATIRCPSCFCTMQAKEYEIDPANPDPENPDWFLEWMGVENDDGGVEAESARSW